MWNHGRVIRQNKKIGPIEKAFNNMKQPRVLINNSLHVKYLHKVTSFLYNLYNLFSVHTAAHVVSGKKSL